MVIALAISEGIGGAGYEVDCGKVFKLVDRYELLIRESKLVTSAVKLDAAADREMLVTASEIGILRLAIAKELLLIEEPVCVPPEVVVGTRAELGHVPFRRPQGSTEQQLSSLEVAQS